MVRCRTSRDSRENLLLAHYPLPRDFAGDVNREYILRTRSPAHQRALRLRYPAAPSGHACTSIFPLELWTRVFQHLAVASGGGRHLLACARVCRALADAARAVHFRMHVFAPGPGPKAHARALARLAGMPPRLRAHVRALRVKLHAGAHNMDAPRVLRALSDALGPQVRALVLLSPARLPGDVVLPLLFPRLRRLELRRVELVDSAHLQQQLVAGPGLRELVLVGVTLANTGVDARDELDVPPAPLRTLEVRDGFAPAPLLDWMCAVSPAAVTSLHVLTLHLREAADVGALVDWLAHEDCTLRKLEVLAEPATNDYFLRDENLRRLGSNHSLRELTFSLAGPTHERVRNLLCFYPDFLHALDFRALHTLRFHVQGWDSERFMRKDPTAFRVLLQDLLATADAAPHQWPGVHTVRLHFPADGVHFLLDPVHVRRGALSGVRLPLAALAGHLYRTGFVHIESGTFLDLDSGEGWSPAVLNFIGCTRQRADVYLKGERSLEDVEMDDTRAEDAVKTEHDGILTSIARLFGYV